MSIIGQQMAESKLRMKYIMRSKKRDLASCIMGCHIPEDQHHQGVCGDFLKDSWPRRCKICGELLFPDKWEPVEPVESDCEHETIGYYNDGSDECKDVGRFPQTCKHCETPLKPKTWKDVK